MIFYLTIQVAIIVMTVKSQTIYKAKESYQEKVMRLESEQQELRKIVAELSSAGKKGCISGTEYYNNGYGEGWPISRQIKFPTLFDDLPIISISITHLDVSNNSNVRVVINTTNSTRSGFSLHMGTWSETKLFAVKCNWMACSKLN